MALLMAAHALPTAVREAVPQILTKDALTVTVQEEIAKRPVRVPAKDTLPAAVWEEFAARPTQVPTKDALSVAVHEEVAARPKPVPAEDTLSMVPTDLVDMSMRHWLGGDGRSSLAVAAVIIRIAIIKLMTIRRIKIRTTYRV